MGSERTAAAWLTMAITPQGAVYFPDTVRNCANPRTGYAATGTTSVTGGLAA